MILWSVQSYEALKNAARRGAFRADGRRIDPWLRPAYQWLSGEMAWRVGPPPAGVRYPMWAWRRPKPDMRDAYRRPHDDSVLVTFEADDDTVLLSDWMQWHHVIGEWFVPETQAEYDEEFVTERKRSAEEIAHSWRHIFDFTTRIRSFSPPPSERMIQATTWTIPLECVVDIRPVKGHCRFSDGRCLGCGALKAAA